MVGAANASSAGACCEQAADVGACGVGEPRVARLVRHQRLAVLPDRLVAVHPRAVVAEDRLRHERRRLAGALRGVADDVLVHHQLVGHPRQGREAHVDLALAGGGDLVMVVLAHDAELLEDQHHLGAELVELSWGGTGK